MKEQAKKKLIKDLIPFLITAAIVLIITIIGLITDLGGLRTQLAGESIVAIIVAVPLAAIILGFEVAGMILGWKWASKRWVALNLWGLLIKLIIACFAGYIIFPIVIVKDIIAYAKA